MVESLPALQGLLPIKRPTGMVFSAHCDCVCITSILFRKEKLFHREKSLLYKTQEANQVIKVDICFALPMFKNTVNCDENN